MWPFRERPSYRDLRETIEKVQRDHVALRAEMDEWLDRLGRLTGRLAKRAAVDLKAMTPDTDAPAQSNGSQEGLTRRSQGGWTFVAGRAFRR